MESVMMLDFNAFLAFTDGNMAETSDYVSFLRVPHRQDRCRLVGIVVRHKRRT